MQNSTVRAFPRERRPALRQQCLPKRLLPLVYLPECGQTNSLLHPPQHRLPNSPRRRPPPTSTFTTGPWLGTALRTSTSSHPRPVRSQTDFQLLVSAHGTATRRGLRRPALRMFRSSTSRTSPTPDLPAGRMRPTDRTVRTMGSPSSRLTSSPKRLRTRWLEVAGRTPWGTS